MRKTQLRLGDNISRQVYPAVRRSERIFSLRKGEGLVWRIDRLLFLELYITHYIQTLERYFLYLQSFGGETAITAHMTLQLGVTLRYSVGVVCVRGDKCLRRLYGTLKTLPTNR